MEILVKGRICIQRTGRTAGEKVIIISLNKKENTAIILKKNGKEKKVNIRHLFPTKTIVNSEDKKELIKKISKVKIE